ncbi:MAG: clan AA aspartic protease (TIGR02281 family) [Gammaproteobacteria bacterium]|jgi:clan AA aspartic protease (TIGR02281 family)
MRKFTIGLIIFMSGWVLSWITSHYLLDKDQRLSAQNDINTPSNSVNPEQPLTVISSTMSADADNLMSLLQQKDFDAAVERFELFQLELNEVAAADAREKILSHVRLLVSRFRFNLAEQLLQRFLIAAFRDVEARFLLADVYFAELDFEAAIDQLYEARGHAFRPDMLQRITSRIQSMVTERASALKIRTDKNALLALYLHLTQLEPEYAPWFINLANAQIALDDKVAARRSLLLVSQNPDVGVQARAMLEALDSAGAGAPATETRVSETNFVGIPLQRRGNHFIVDASPAGNRNLRLLIDTGASLTMLTPEVFERAGIQYQNTGRTDVFNTANGSVRAPIYILDSLEIGDWKVNQLEVGVLALGGHSNIDGLLGMNFLRHFQFFIDQNEAMLRLSIN